MTRELAIVAVLIAVVVGLVVFFGGKNSEAPAPPIGKISTEVDQAIRARVVLFGEVLQNVTLLMPPEDVARQMAEHYGPYLTPELLAKWQLDPAQAIGRKVSSPWPDRIEVVTVSPRGDNTYIVEGNVIEVTSADTPLQPAGVYPVTLLVEERNGEWLISDLTQGAYSEVPQRIEVVGIWECVPLKSGLASKECIKGVARDQSDAHFIVDTRLMAAVLTVRMGDRVRVEGIMVPANQLSSDQWQRYRIDGIISATVVQQL